MKESYEKSQPLGAEPYADEGNLLGVAWARGTRRPAIELRNPPFRVPELDDIPPCEGRLILLHGSQPDGSFSPHAFNRKMVQRLEQVTELGKDRD